MKKIDNKLKCAIIGCGVIASKHAAGIINCEDAELYAVCDIIEDTAKKFAEKYGVEKYFIDYKDVVELKEIDMICMCLPSGLHADITVEFAKAGKHVLCEKPLDITTQKLDMMIKAFDDNKVKLGAIFQNRTYSGPKKAKELLEEGKLGKILIADGYMKLYRSPEYYKSAGWRGTIALDGGGCLMNQGVHGIDLLCWLAGEVESIVAKTYTKARDIEVEDSAFALVNFKNGASGIIEGSTISLPGLDERIEIQCEKGRIVYDTRITTLYQVDENGKIVETSLDTEDIEESNTANDPSAFPSTTHEFLVADMVRAIIEDRDPFITGAMARHAVDVILAIYESSRVGKEVFLK